jgi:hypothetical protein
MRPKEAYSKSERTRRPASEVIDAVIENMRENLEPLKYSTLVPSRYVIYLHPSEYSRLEGIIAVLKQQTIRALSEEMASLNRTSKLRHYAQRLLKGRGVRVENPGDDWSVEFLPDPDGELQEGDILIDSELLLPAAPELGFGERTRLVRTNRSAKGTTSTERTLDRPSESANPKPLARIEFEDTAGRHAYDLRNSVIIGRGGSSYPVDIKIVSSVDVSREHARIRHDERTGEFFLIDLSTLGTTVDGRHVPRGYDEIGGTRKANGAETRLPDEARIGLAETVYLQFRKVHR